VVLVPCPLFVGRDGELAALGETLTAAAGGRGQAIVLVGEAGIGKSRLLRELIDEAGRRGLPVFSGRAVDRATPSPFRPLTEALLSHLRRSEPAHTVALQPFHSALARLAPGWAPGAAEATDASTVVVAEAVLRLIAAAGEGSGCLLALEDLHWADPETIDVVEYLADNVAGEPLLCIATVRDDEPTVAAQRLHRLVTRRAATAITLGRLDAASARAMAAACLGPDEVPDADPPALSAAEGLPFLVEELLVDAAHRDRGSREALGVPEAFAATVRRRLDAAPGTAEVLSPAALLGRSFDWNLLPAITRLSDDEVAVRLRRAAEAHLVEDDATGTGTRMRFRHALTHAAILADLLPPERVAVATQALVAVEATHPGLPGEWCDLAAQLADQAGLSARASELSLEAGRRAFGRGALATAEACLDRARLRAGDDPAMTVEVDQALCATLALAGDRPRLEEVGERLLEELAAVAAPAARVGEVHLRLARAAIAGADWAAAGRHLERAGRLGGETSPVEAHLLAAEVALGRDDPDTATELARRALAGARDGGRPDLACEALQLLGRRERQRDLAAAERAFADALELAQANALTLARIRALHELGTIELLAGGPVDRLIDARGAALAAGALSTAAIVGLQVAAWHLNRLDLEATVDTARTFSAEARRLRMPLVEALGSVLEACAHAQRGSRKEMEEALARALGLAGHVPEVRGAAALQARATYWLVREDRGRAVAALDEGMAELRATLATTPFRGMWVLLHAIDDRDGQVAVDEVAASGHTVYWPIRGWVGHAQAVLHGRAGARSAAMVAFTAADATLAPCPWYRQHARRLVAEAAIADGWGDPESWLTEALAFFETEGDDRVASACRALLRRMGATVPRRRRPADVPPALAGFGLTARELEVLVFLGYARPTRDIAAQLVLSPKTVERHVENLAAKVGVRGRAELIAFAAAQLGSERQP
jgi:DNA-binding CsgD family transcriptional regulator